MKDDKVIDFVKKLNESYTDSFNIPILGGFKVINNPGTLFTAISPEGYVEQFILDGKLLDDEDFDSRLDKVISKTKQSMRDSGLDNPDAHFIFHKNCKVNGIDFTIYIQDNIVNVSGKERIIRQFNLYFLDKNSNNFHLLTIATPPIELPNNIIIVDRIDLENDEMTKSLDITATDIMNHITYK